MRHFAQELQGEGYRVVYYPAQGSAIEAFRKFAEKHCPEQVWIMETAEFGRAGRIAELVRAMAIQVEVLPNSMFITPKEDFSQWAEKRKSLVMEYFYREVRMQTGLLMEGMDPIGGKWNYDTENRSKPPAGHSFPLIPSYPPDMETQAVIALVEAKFQDNFGLTADFSWPVTRSDAMDFVENFIENRLDLFGPYQDAMVQGEETLYHSLLSPMLNIGLLEPLELCRLADAAYQQGKIRINSAEAFIRQILGWREFIHHTYHLQMPGYLKQNYFGVDRPLPDFYWTAATDMLCVSEAVKALQKRGINHHIQRLMVTGNLALIAGFDPTEVNEWYWTAYMDAYEWVVSPNVLGMTLFADGGMIASKPYAASANYINKMSDYCTSCRYKPKGILDQDACPFNALYWNFLDRNEALLTKNPRMNLMLSLLGRKSREERVEIQRKAAQIMEEFNS
jgi:deoxyribodipyrimidine photolyase-related protein